MDGRKIRFSNIIDEYTHECITSVPRRSWRNNDIIELLSLFSLATLGMSSHTLLFFDFVMSQILPVKCSKISIRKGPEALHEKSPTAKCKRTGGLHYYLV